MKTPKIVFIGAGSMSFGIPTFKDIFTTPQLKGATLSLVDIDEENLERMYALALTMNEASGMELKIEKTMERRDVLPGADYIVNSLAIERCDLWKHDFQVPLKYGIKHCLGENGGPGALFFGMRTIPLIMDICRDIEELCPDAWFLNFSNPESRIVIYYNKDIFNEIGADVPKTVDELEDIMAKAKDAGYIPTECAGDVYHQMLWAVGSMVLNSAPKEEIDDWYYGKDCTDNVKQAFIDAYTRVLDWYNNGYFRDNFEGTKLDDIPTLFSQGQTAFVIGGDWDIANYEATGLNVGAFVFPGFNADEEPYIVNATDGAWALNADLTPTEKEAALDFIDIFYQDDYVKKWYENGFTLATLTDVSDVETTELHKEIASATQNTKIGFYLDNTKSGFLDYMVRETQLMIQGQYTPETLWDSLYKEWSNR